MNQKKLLKIVNDSFKRRTKILEKKNNDYADEDSLSNFKLTSMIFRELTGLAFTPYHSVLFLEILKLVRETNIILKKKGVVMNEGLGDTLDDADNYGDLKRAILYEMDILKDDEISLE